jgi:hypothetical protein
MQNHKKNLILLNLVRVWFGNSRILAQITRATNGTYSVVQPVLAAASSFSGHTIGFC